MSSVHNSSEDNLASIAATLGSNIPAEPAQRRGRPKAAIGLPSRVKIILEENDNIPPTGLYVGLNGVGYLIRPGREVEVPMGVVDILDHAIETRAVVDPDTNKQVGWRDRQKFPYRKIT